MNKLNDKQKRFCEEYLKDMNGTQAAIRAGYSEKTANRIASENLSKPDIKTYIQELQTDVQKRNEISIDEIVQNLIEIKNRCMQNVPVMTYDKVNMVYVQVLDENGRVIWNFDAAGALKALDLLMKHLGGYNADNQQKQPTVITETGGWETAEAFTEHFLKMIGE